MKPLRIWVAGILIVLGALWLLDSAGLVTAWPLIDHWWPAAVIVLGVLALLGERRLAPGPVILILVGAAMLIGRLRTADTGGLIWPIVAIVAGAWLLLSIARQQTHGPQVSERQDVLALLGGSHTSNRSDHFRQANVSAVFGGASLDLREARLAPGARVDAFALFGGVDVIVPTTWRVEVSGLPIFGGYQDKTRGQSELSADAPVLKVSALAMFGGVEVKNSPVMDRRAAVTGADRVTSSAPTDLR